MSSYNAIAISRSAAMTQVKLLTCIKDLGFYCCSLIPKMCCRKVFQIIYCCSIVIRHVGHAINL